MLHNRPALNACVLIMAAAAAGCGMRTTYAGAPFRPSPAEDLIPAPTAVQERLANAAQPVTFRVNEAEPEDRERMLSIAAVLREIHGEFPHVIFVIEGHSDDSGPAEFNHMLALRRATAVQQTLISLGVPATQLRTVSFGESRPVCTGTERSCRERNRRVEFKAAVQAIGCAP